ncbi:hypothetical protein GJ668_07305 [Allochromatium palmeri]|uniref:Uncharacterized protein n=1 Tax=Allochromatium palmeri TaxID=231048 RepID=A0A6N8EE60_9GAMM|nr:hypothetical protein [Allochromatium palmeri]
MGTFGAGARGTGQALMGLPEWLTISVAESGRGRGSKGQGRIGGLCFIADPILAERLRRTSTAIFDLDAWALVDRGEFVDPGSLTPFASHADEPLDRHRLDVALSRGRHAAERAKLAGCQTLICLGIADDDGLNDWFRLDTAKPPCRTTAASDYPRCNRHDSASSGQAAYARLRQIARFEIAALTGALIASAQMGLQAYPRGYLAWVAARIALELNPGVGDWLVDSRSATPQVSRIEPTCSITAGIAAVTGEDRSSVSSRHSGTMPTRTISVGP